jgi:hypothetical protein
MHKKQIRPLARLHGYWLYRHWLPGLQLWSVAQRRAWIFERLKRTLALAAGGVPFYQDRFREAGFDPQRDFNSLADLTRVPVLTKDDVRKNFDRLIDRRFMRGSVLAHTSGTTGQPMSMRLNERYVAVDYACMFRHWAKAGYAFRAPFAAVRSYVPDTPDGPRWVRNWWQNTLYMSAYHLKPSNAEEYIQELLRFRPQFIRGYVSSVNVLAEFAYPHREKFDFVRGVFTASETLSDFERANIERTFGRKLYDWYGMTEPAVVITERADHDGMEVDWARPGQQRTPAHHHEPAQSGDAVPPLRDGGHRRYHGWHGLRRTLSENPRDARPEGRMPRHAFGRTAALAELLLAAPNLHRGPAVPICANEPRSCDPENLASARHRQPRRAGVRLAGGDQ